MHRYTVTQLSIYPIKGLAGINLTRSTVKEKGLLYDRQWMLIHSEDNTFISQRNHAALALFKTAINDGEVEVSFGDESCSFFIHNAAPTSTFEATIWDDQVTVCEVDKSVSAWFSKILKAECKLVTMADHAVRNKPIADERYAAPINFPDGYPILTIGTESMHELNAKCGEEINTNRFRPNIVIETVSAHEEDQWSHFNVKADHGAALRVIRPCIRCQVINIDQENGSIHLEPTKTLASYRRTDKGIQFGANTICLKEGTIRVGDEILLS